MAMHCENAIPVTLSVCPQEIITIVTLSYNNAYKSCFL